MKGTADRISRQPKWKKVAYGGMQPSYDDNYTDKSFLEAMVMNANVVKRDIFKVMQDSVSISQYLCIFALVISVWIHMLGSVIDETALNLDVGLLALGFSVLFLATSQLSLDLLSVLLFAPLITFCIKKYSFKLHLWFSFALMSMTLSIVFWLHHMLFVLLLGFPVFVSIVCPYWLIRIQEYKFEINGPWEEAKLCLDITE